MDITGNQLPAATVGTIIRKVVELENNGGLLIYPSEGEPIMITPQHEMWPLVMGAHKAAMEVAKTTPDSKQSWWNRLTNFVAEKWAQIRGTPDRQRSRIADQTVASANRGKARVEPAVSAQPQRDHVAMEPVPTAVRQQTMQQVQTELSKESSKAPAKTEKLDAAEKGLQKAKEDAENILFKTIVWDKQKGFTATIGDGREVAIGKEGPAAEEFHKMMGGLAKMIREVHEEKEKLQGAKAEKAVEKSNERPLKLRQPETPSRDEKGHTEATPAKSDKVPTAAKKEDPAVETESKEEKAETARQPEVGAEPKAAAVSSEPPVSSNEVEAAVTNANRTIESTLEGHENAVFTPIIFEDDRETLFVVRTFAEGKEVFYKASIPSDKIMEFVERFQGVEPTVPILGRVEVNDGKAELVSMYSQDTYGKQAPSKTIESLTGAVALPLERIEDPEKVLREDTKIFSGMARVSAMMLTKAIETPAASIEQNEPEKIAAAKSVDDINAELAGASEQQLSSAEHEPSASSGISLEPVADLEARATTPSSHELFADYRKQSGKEK